MRRHHRHQHGIAGAERHLLRAAPIGLVPRQVPVPASVIALMLDTVREFGAERLEASGELAACRARHISRYLAMGRYFGGHFADDDQMDRLHRKLFDALLSPKWRHGVEPAVDISLAGRYFERFADHAVHVAENVVYLVTGQHPEEIETAG